MEPWSDCSKGDRFTALPEPRIDRAKRYALPAIITIARRSAALFPGWRSNASAAPGGVGPRRCWLCPTVSLPRRVSVFAALDSTELETAVLGWVQALLTAADGVIVAIDGKALRCSHDRMQPPKTDLQCICLPPVRAIACLQKATTRSAHSPPRAKKTPTALPR